MAKVITLSRTFPAYHPKAGQPTYFVEQVLNALGSIGIHMTFQHLIDLNDEEKISEPQLWKFWCEVVNGIHNNKISSHKLHTIRAGHRWETGDKASLRVWSGKPYKSPQIIISPEVELVDVYDFEIAKNPFPTGPEAYHGINGLHFELDEVAKNDGLSVQDLKDWFKYPNPFEGQILAWRPVDYV